MARAGGGRRRRDDEKRKMEERKKEADRREGMIEVDGREKIEEGRVRRW